MSSLYCLPIVFSNLGVEMLYVLEQRLRAQKISEDKAVKVLHDVVKAMFDPQFVDELFKPQEVYTQKATRHIFDKLAHSSIMRLSENSMDKLYDLMTMVFKYQLVNCLQPREIMDVTLTHLATIKSYMTDRAVIKLADDFEKRARDLYGTFQPFDWIELCRTLFHFLQGKSIKVSLLLQEGLQNPDGTIKVPPQSQLLGALGPAGTDSRDDFGGERSQMDIKKELPPGSDDWVPPPVHLGGNLYSKDRQAPKPPEPFVTAPVMEHPGKEKSETKKSSTGLPKIPTRASPARIGSPARSAAEGPRGVADQLFESAGKEGARELNTLAGLIRPKRDDDAFKLNLFGDAGGGDGGMRGGNAPPRDDVIVLGGDEGNRETGLADVIRSFSLDDAKNGAAGAVQDEEEEDDLLALMDGA